MKCISFYSNATQHSKYPSYNTEYDIIIKTTAYLFVAFLMLL